MPKFYTKAFEDKVMYFDLRFGGTGQAEGVFARPVFANQELELERKALREGRQEQLWIDLLVSSITGWEGFYDVAGKALAFSEAQLRELCESDTAFMRTLLHMIRNAKFASFADAEKN